MEVGHDTKEVGAHLGLWGDVDLLVQPYAVRHVCLVADSTDKVEPIRSLSTGTERRAVRGLQHPSAYHLYEIGPL